MLENATGVLSPKLKTEQHTIQMINNVIHRINTEGMDIYEILEVNIA